MRLVLDSPAFVICTDLLYCSVCLLWECMQAPQDGLRRGDTRRVMLSVVSGYCCTRLECYPVTMVSAIDGTYRRDAVDIDHVALSMPISAVYVA